MATIAVLRRPIGYSLFSPVSISILCVYTSVYIFLAYTYQIRLKMHSHAQTYIAYVCTYNIKASSNTHTHTLWWLLRCHQSPLQTEMPSSLWPS